MAYVEPSQLLRTARLDAGLTQAQLAARLGVTQPTIAALERPGANPRVRTLERALAATGHRMQVLAPAWGAPVDAALVRGHRKLTPRARLEELARMRRAADVLTKARRVR